MTAYEKAVIKAFLNEAFGQMSAEVDGQTIIPRYFYTDTSYVKKESKEIPDYLKGKFIELPDDLKKKHGGIVAVLFLDD